jgi:hypothetical protein
VSPSMLEMLRVRSSEPSASKLLELQAPHVIALLCFPIKDKKISEHTSVAVSGADRL